MPKGSNVRTPKMLGDAGEYYSVSRFIFAGRPATKMPDGWEGYDLAVESGTGLKQVSVKTRSESIGWKASSWFTFDDRRICDWIVFIFLAKDASIRAWVIPFEVAKAQANKPGPNRKDAHWRDITWGKLTKEPLLAYEDNWTLAQS